MSSEVEYRSSGSGCLWVFAAIAGLALLVALALTVTGTLDSFFAWRTAAANAHAEVMQAQELGSTERLQTVAMVVGAGGGLSTFILGMIAGGIVTLGALNIAVRQQRTLE
jgi:hypothetical protein